MATTISNLRAKLNTHATTAGAANYLWGWIDEVNSFIQDKATKFPILVVQPVNWGINPRGLSGFEIDLKFQIYKNNDPDGAIERSTTFDEMIVIAKAFIVAINTDDNLSVTSKFINIQLFDVGQIVEQALMIAIDTKLTIIC